MGASLYSVSGQKKESKIEFSPKCLKRMWSNFYILLQQLERVCVSEFDIFPSALIKGGENRGAYLPTVLKEWPLRVQLVTIEDCR